MRLSQLSKAFLIISHLGALARITYPSHQDTAKWPFSSFSCSFCLPLPSFPDFPVPITCLKRSHPTSHQTNADQDVIQLHFEHRNYHVRTQITLSPGLLLEDS